MPTDRALLLVIHLIAAVFMAAPLYALIASGERGRLGLPPNYNTDRFLENILRGQPLRCYIYIATLIATGLLLISARGMGLGALVSDWALAGKTAGTLLLLGILSYTHFSIQPKIDALVNQASPGSPLPEDVRPQFLALRTRRRRLAGVCLFLVLSIVTLGLRVFTGFSAGLALAFIALAALFAWLAFKRLVPYGWV